LLGGHFLAPHCGFEAIVREFISIRLDCAGTQEKRQDGRQEEKSHEVYISGMCGATPSRQISTKLGKYVRLTDVIKRAKLHCYSFRGFGAVTC